MSSIVNIFFILIEAVGIIQKKMPNKMISFVSQHKSAFTFPCMKFEEDKLQSLLSP